MSGQLARMQIPNQNMSAPQRQSFNQQQMQQPMQPMRPQMQQLVQQLAPSLLNQQMPTAPQVQQSFAPTPSTQPFTSSFYDGSATHSGGRNPVTGEFYPGKTFYPEYYNPDPSMADFYNNQERMRGSEPPNAPSFPGTRTVGVNLLTAPKSAPKKAPARAK